MFLENLSCVKPAGTEVTPKASPLEGQTAKVGKKGRKHSGVLSVMTWGPNPGQPWHAAGLDASSGSGEGATKTHREYKLSRFHLTAWRGGTAMFVLDLR